MWAVTEPREVADRIEQVADGVWHWRIRNANIGGGISSSHAVATDGGCVLIDPVRLAPEALASLPPPEAVLLDARTHQRAAWRYRCELGIEVWMPDDAPEAEEEPDRRFAGGDVLPGGLEAIRTPGPEWPHYSFLLPREPGVLFCSDLLTYYGDELDFVPFEYHDDPDETRRSVERLLDLEFTILCLDHGRPLEDDPKAAIRDLLATAA
jgi:glyoxylase-like metal-dependent hydrolase (beta-lactamase superfamily II)